MSDRRRWNESREDFMALVQFPWIMTADGADGVHPPQKMSIVDANAYEGTFL